MSPSRAKQSDAPTMAKRLWWGTALATAACLAVIAAGLAYGRQRGIELARYLQERTDSKARAMELLLENAQLRAWAGDAPLHLAPDDDFVETLRLARQGESYSVSRLSGPPLVPLSSAVLSRGVVGPFLYPPAAPAAVVFCPRPATNTADCAAVGLAGLVSHARESSRRSVPTEILTPGGEVIARTQDWEPEESPLTAESQLSVGRLTLRVRTQAGARLRRAFSASAGYAVAAVALVAWLVVVATLRARNKGKLKELRLRQEVERSMRGRYDLVRSTLGNLAEATGLLVWLLRDDQRLELSGPWDAELGLEGSEVDLATAMANVKDGREVADSVLTALRERKSWSRVTLVDVDGEEVTFQSAAAPLFDNDGNFVALVGVTSNITTALETKAQVLRDEAFRSAHAEYVRLMARELSGPALHVTGVVGLLERGLSSLDPEQKRLLSLAATEARRLSEVVRASLDLMHLRNSSAKDQLRAVEPGPILQEVASDLQSKVPAEREHAIRVDIQSTRPALIHRPSLLRMLEIVLTNALMYSPPATEVRARVVDRDDSVVIEVDDAGPGMDPGEMSRLGEPFFRGVSSIGAPGIGLGVATAFELATHSGSTIRFQRSAEPTRGLLVSISLPAAPVGGPTRRTL